MSLSVQRGWAAPSDRWSDHDVVLSSALTLYEAGLCPGCSQPLVESTDPAHDPHDPAGTGRYVVADPVRCYACSAIDAKARLYEKAEQPRALRFGAWLKKRLG